MSKIRKYFTGGTSLSSEAVNGPNFLFKFKSLPEYSGFNINKNYLNSNSVLPSNNTNNILALTIPALTGLISDNINLGDSEWGRTLGNIFSQGINSAGNTVANNILKGNTLFLGLQENVGSSIAGSTAGLVGNLIGKGINSLGGDSKLSRGIGLGVATGIGMVGGEVLSNAIKGGKTFGLIGDSIKAIKGIKTASNLSKAAAVSNIAGLGASVVGAGLQAALGPSKEYGGRYGSITRGMDTAYDLVLAGVGFIPGVGTAISGAMALNKGLSNVFGSTDGMTKQDAILGSAFMPAPVKWLNMAGAKTTDKFNLQSLRNIQNTNSFMQNAFGNLSDYWDKAREESKKTYGTFSRNAYKRANKNIEFSNKSFKDVLDMYYQNRLQNIRSEDMTSINNQKYALDIMGGFNPLYRKEGGLIIYNATNPEISMRLLSGAALIDNKQMILSKCREAN